MVYTLVLPFDPCLLAHSVLTTVSPPPFPLVIIIERHSVDVRYMKLFMVTLQMNI